jgi:hypothetical protein
LTRSASQPKKIKNEVVEAFDCRNGFSKAIFCMPSIVDSIIDFRFELDI